MAILNTNWIWVKANSHAEDINQLTEDERYWDGPKLCPIIFPWRFSSVLDFLKESDIPLETITKLKISGTINSVDIRVLRELSGIGSFLSYPWEYYEGEPLHFDSFDNHLIALDLSDAEIVSNQWYRRIDSYDKHGYWSMGIFGNKEFSDYCHPYELDDWFIGSTTLEHLVLPSNIIRVNSIPTIKNLYAKPDSEIIKDVLWEKAGLSKPIIRKIEELIQSDDKDNGISNAIKLNKQNNEKQHMTNDKEKSEEPRNSNTGLKDEKTVENTKAEQIFKQAESICEGRENVDKSLIDSHKAFLLFQEAAQMGNAEAQCCLGCCYRNGYGTQVDHQKARFWYDNSSKNGCSRALEHIAQTYKNGQGVSQSYEKAVEWYTMAAEQGRAIAQFNLGIYYAKGQGVPQNYEKAAEWYTKAAEQGNASAQTNLGSCYYNGNGVPQSYEKAVEWYTKAAEQGETIAQFCLGNCCYYGNGVSQSYEKAVEWYTKAAEQGDETAQYKLGLCYYNGQGVSQSYEKAVEWFTKVAEQGNTKAQIKLKELGDCYYYGKGVPQNYEKAAGCYIKAAEHDAIVLYNLGCCCRNKGPKGCEEAVYWYAKSAILGNVTAQGMVEIWQNAPHIYENAVEVFTKAAEQGNAIAQLYLGDCYAKGLCLPKNYKIAVCWYALSAILGNANAQYNLGYCLERGQGIPQSYEGAVYWYTKAAEQGHSEAQNELGNCYNDGKGVPQSYEKAQEWFIKAAKQGDVWAEMKLDPYYAKNNDSKVATTSNNDVINIDKRYDKGASVYQGFNYDQQTVIKLYKGHHLVLAPPGCGKTRVLAERVMHAIDNGIQVEDMLCLTFTNRAAREMKERIDKRVESEDIERLFVGNVHHFCSSLLRENKVIAQKTTIIDDEEKNVVISEIIKNKYGISPTNVDDYYYFQHYLYQIENHYPTELIVKPEMERYLEDESYLRVAREYLSYKKRYDLIDFEDLLLYGYDYLVNHQNDVKRYSWIQVDEVQDLNRLQLAIIEMVTAHETPCAVYLGDEQQAIYSFMGAKLETLKYLKDQCQGNIHHFLGNYRSPKYLLDVYNKYAEVNLDVDKDLLPQAQGENADMAMPQDGLLIESCEQREGFNKWDYCALDMAVDRAIAYPDGRTAILTYSNKDSDKISERLERKGVEHFKIAGTDFLWTKEVKLIFSHLNVFTQPENIMSWARILQGIGVCKKMEKAHQLISEANNASLRGNDLLDDARHQMIKKFVYDCAQEYVIFDTETTGLDVNQDDIVEIAAIRIRNGVIDAEFDIMLYTEKTIPPMLGETKNPLPEEYAKREKLNRKEGLQTFLVWVGDLPVLAHNVKYDYQILDANLKRDCGISDLDKRWERVHDSLAITRVIEPNLHSYKLKDLLTTFALQGKNSHLAIDDAKATKSLVDYCHRKASMVFVLQNDFFAKYKDMITRTKELYGELYSHTKSLLQQKPADGERNLLASEMEYAYHYFQNKGMIDELPKMKYLMPFISEDFISDTDLSLQQLLDKYMVEIMTLRESDLCESKSMKDKVKIYVSTIHRAKGLEFENVVVFDVRDGLFPFFEWNQILNRTFDPAERKFANEGIQEDARELYVAISRAKKRLCIQYPRNNTGYGKNGWYEWSAKESPFMACIKHLFITLDK